MSELSPPRLAHGNGLGSSPMHPPTGARRRTWMRSSRSDASLEAYDPSKANNESHTADGHDLDLHGYKPRERKIMRAPERILRKKRSFSNIPEAFGLDGCEDKVVAIYTSGGDAPGMNGAYRAAAGVCLTAKATVYAVKNGYKGLVNGGDYFHKVGWEDIEDILQLGGTVIGSARCMEFKERAGRLSAAENLVKRGIFNLIAIGGDGTLTGANVFKLEWPSLLAELLTAGRITEDERSKCMYLNVIGMVGSIDNDMCGFSMTIGCDTAMHRIVNAIDSLLTTAESHERTFIVEVMGRNCGYLALMAGLAVGADWVFVPENPPNVEDWETAMCDSLERRKRLGHKFSLVIVAEGATDRVRRPITSEYLKSVLSKRLGHDTRITCLGHVQRGGAPSAYDRILSTRLGAEAALALLHADKEDPASIIGIRWNQVIKVDLENSVAQTKAVNVALRARDFEQARRLRGPAFIEELSIYKNSRTLRHLTEGLATEPTLNIAVMFAGAPAAGMNAAAKGVVRLAILNNLRVFGVHEGFPGLADGRLQELTYNSVHQWTLKGGAKLGTKRDTPRDVRDSNGESVGLQRIAAQLAAHNIHGLIVIGGFEAYSGLFEIGEARGQYPAFCIPMCLIPATVSNNVPGTDFSLGSDTALNAIVEATDKLQTSASSSRRRVFIVETMGGYCGYLATMGALAAGADDAYTHEEGVHIEDMQADIQHVREKLNTFKKALFIRSERCSQNYSTAFMQALFEEEGRYESQDFRSFSTRSNILGHLQQGGASSPLDRVRGMRLASHAVNYLLRHMQDSKTPDGKTSTSDPSSLCVVGIKDAKATATPIADLVADTDFNHRVPKTQWYTRLLTLLRLLEKNRRVDDQHASECNDVTMPIS